MPDITVSGVNTYYQVDGSGARTFFLFNGAGCSAHEWDELIPGLSKLGKVVRFDARGTGQTEAGEQPYTLKMFAEDGLALMDYLHLEKPIILAHAFGGRVAQVFLRDHPARARALVLCGTGGLFPPLPAFPGGLPTGPDAAIEIQLGTYYGPRFRVRHPERAKRIMEEFLAQRRDNPPARQRLTQIEAAESYWGKVPEGLPVLLIYGTEDKFGHEKNYRDLAQRIKGSRQVMIEGAGHMAIQEEPEQVVAAIRSFVEEKGL